MATKKNRIEKEIVCCAENINKDIIKKIRKEDFIDEQSVQVLASFFSAFSDPTRLRIIGLLMKQELCVCDIAYLLELKQPAVSQQLSTLWKARIVKRRKDGNQVFYRLDDEHVEKIYKIGEEHTYE